jgi:hypothetical protein
MGTAHVIVVMIIIVMCNTVKHSHHTHLCGECLMIRVREVQQWLRVERFAPDGKREIALIGGGEVIRKGRNIKR